MGIPRSNGIRKEDSRVKARKKSIQDIRNQFERIKNLRQYAQSNYYNRVFGDNGARGIAQRYIDNITKQKGYQRAVRKGYRAYSNNDHENTRKNFDAADNIKYSRSTYMGLSNG